MNSNYKMYVLGSRGTHSVFGKEYEQFGGQTSCYIFKSLNHAIILDCGTGLYDAKDLLKDCDIIDIILTHVHYDHFLGLTKVDIFNSNAKITIYGTISKWFKSGDIKELFKPPLWPVYAMNCKTIDINNDGSLIKINENVSFEAYPSNHPNDASIICLYFDNKKITIATDFEKDDSKDTSFINNSDMLFYDGMYDVDDYKTHIGWGHSTWKDAISVAKNYNINKLYIIHHNPNYDDNKLLQMEKKCKEEFIDSRFVRVNDIYDI